MTYMHFSIDNILSTYTVCEAYNAKTAKSAFLIQYFSCFAVQTHKHS